ncbi:hypothetical protein, partial [Xanthomonas hortorum]|uniref:hypothetical protein n=1 Tax=Xanthomonas hortorum TaxID=56454 RepID=UPI002044AC87
MAGTRQVSNDASRRYKQKDAADPCPRLSEVMESEDEQRKEKSERPDKTDALCELLHERSSMTRQALLL